MSTSGGQHHPFARILIVDAHAGFRTALVDMLRREYPHSDLVETGTIEEARLRLAAYPVDLAFVTMRLPDGSGLQLIREVKAAHPATLTVLLASDDAPEYRQAAAEHGASHCIGKRELTIEAIRAPVAAALAAKAPPGRARLTPARMATDKGTTARGKSTPTRRGQPKRT
jgi:DNA-binding NarL/FixJ family response regulator